MNTSKLIVLAMMLTRTSLACLVGTSACSGDVNIDGQTEVCPETVPCATCEDLIVSGGDTRMICDGEGDAFYGVWSCVIDAPQCDPCPTWPDYNVFEPIPLDQECLECLVFEGCGAELNACGVSVSP